MSEVFLTNSRANVPIHVSSLASDPVGLFFATDSSWSIVSLPHTLSSSSLFPLPLPLSLCKGGERTLKQSIILPTLGEKLK